MKIKKIKLIILVILLLILSLSLIEISGQNNFLRKNIDQVFINAVSDSMNGLSMDYTKLDSEQKEQYYYQTLYNLKDALEVFYLSSYKKYNDLYKALSRLQMYLIKNINDNYEIDGKQYIFSFLGKILVFPNDNQSISDFNSFLDSKSK